MSEVFITIYDTRIQEMDAKGGMVNRYVVRKTREVEAIAKLGCPVRSGRLHRSITSSVSMTLGGCNGDVSVGAYYGMWVMHGTTTIHGSPKMRVPKHRGLLRGADLPIGSVKYRTRVAGQRPQPFLEEALDAVMAGSTFLGRR